MRRMRRTVSMPSIPGGILTSMYANRDRPTPLPCAENQLAGLLAGGGVQQFERGQKRHGQPLPVGFEQSDKLADRVRRLQHLPEVVVNLGLVVDDQDAQVGLTRRLRGARGAGDRRAGHRVLAGPCSAGGSTEDSGSVMRIVVPVPVPVPVLRGSMRPPQPITKLAAECRPRPLPDCLVV